MDKNEVFWARFGAPKGIAFVALISKVFFEGVGLTIIIGSFGASAAPLYGVCVSPLTPNRCYLI